MKKLSKRQQEIYDFIKRSIQENGYAPSVRDIGKAVNLSSPSSVHVHLKNLEDAGCIKRDALKSRSITLTENENSGLSDISTVLNSNEASSLNNVFTSHSVPVPLVGNVAAGVPILAEENIEEYMSLPVDIVGDSAGFMLSVRGDSMVECGINNGDYVVVREQKTANNGDIVVALLDDGATVKRFYKEKDCIRLQPENSSMEPIRTTHCSIVGKVVAVFRRVS